MRHKEHYGKDGNRLELHPAVAAVLAGRMTLDPEAGRFAVPGPTARQTVRARLWVRDRIDPRLACLLADLRAGDRDDEERFARACRVARRVSDSVFFRQVAGAMESIARYGARRWAIGVALGAGVTGKAELCRWVRDLTGVEPTIQDVGGELRALAGDLRRAVSVALAAGISGKAEICGWIKNLTGIEPAIQDVGGELRALTGRG